MGGASERPGRYRGRGGRAVAQVVVRTAQPSGRGGPGGAGTSCCAAAGREGGRCAPSRCVCVSRFACGRERCRRTSGAGAQGNKGKAKTNRTRRNLENLRLVVAARHLPPFARAGKRRAPRPGLGRACPCATPRSSGRAIGSADTTGIPRFCCKILSFPPHFLPTYDAHACRGRGRGRGEILFKSAHAQL